MDVVRISLQLQPSGCRERSTSHPPLGHPASVCGRRGAARKSAACATPGSIRSPSVHLAVAEPDATENGGGTPGPGTGPDRPADAATPPDGASRSSTPGSGGLPPPSPGPETEPPNPKDRTQPKRRKSPRRHATPACLGESCNRLRRDPSHSNLHEQ